MYSLLFITCVPFILLVSLIYLRIVSVKQFAVAVLKSYQHFGVLMLRLRGVTQQQEAEKRIVSGQAWEEFCDALKASGAAMMFPGTPKDGFNQAEGYRYLSRLVRAALENFVESADPTAPTLTAIVDGYRSSGPIKLGNDNPDNLYQNAMISSELEYRVSGTRGTVPYLGFGTQSGQYGKPGGLSTVDYKSADELDIDENGHFELIISVKPPKNRKNWLRLKETPSQGLLLIRQTFTNRETQLPATIKIEVLDRPNLPQPITPSFLDDALNSASLFVTGASLMFANWAKNLKAHVNTLPLFDQETSNKAGGDPHIRYFHSYWNLKDDEALVITATPPRCQYWNFVLHNHWMESLDYRYYQIHANPDKCRLRSDGTIKIIVSHDNPNSGVDKGYWINTAHHRCGTMSFRWVRPHTEDDGPNLPHPICKVVNFQDLE